MAEVIRYAMIRNNIVENISLWDGDVRTWQPPEDMLVIPAPDYIGIGWGYENGNWTEPVPPPEPTPEPTPDPVSDQTI